MDRGYSPTGVYRPIPHPQLDYSISASIHDFHESLIQSKTYALCSPTHLMQNNLQIDLHRLVLYYETAHARSY